jgi:hypothetical protein
MVDSCSYEIARCSARRPLRRAADIDDFHAFMVEGAKFMGLMDLPRLEPVHVDPQTLVSFPDAVGGECGSGDPGAFVHFYTDDFRFERFWKNPKKYLPRLLTYGGLIEPDFSTCVSFPAAVKAGNAYRNRACAYWLQCNGATVVPNVRIDELTKWYALAGIPHESTIAIGAHGCIKNVENRRRFVKSLKIAVDELCPSNIIVAGSDAYGVFDYPRELGIPVKVISIDGRQKSGAREQ